MNGSCGAEVVRGGRSADDDVNAVGTDTLTSVCPYAPPDVPRTDPTKNTRTDFLIIIDARERTTLKDFHVTEKLQK
jgi:hypothetical protein